MVTTTDLITEAQDGKTDIVKRFAVDVAAIRASDKDGMPVNVAGNVFDHRPLGEDQIRMLDYEADHLKNAEIFAWDPAIVRRVRQMGADDKFPGDVPFSKAWLYAPQGLWWFGRHNPHILLHSATMDPTGGEVRRPCCALSYMAFPHRPDDIMIDGFSFEHPEPTPGPISVTKAFIKGGQTLNDLQASWVEQQNAAMDQLFEKITESKAKLLDMGYTEDDLSSPTLLANAAAKHQFISKQDYLRAMKALQRLVTIKSTRRLVMFFLAGSLWMQQKVASISYGVPNRHARKRAEREHIPVTSTRIVTLRRAEAQPVQNPGTGTPLNYRILVGEHTGGFWRNQFFPSTGTRMPIWIDPFWKGPKDAPVKIPGKVVYKVSR